MRGSVHLAAAAAFALALAAYANSLPNGFACDDPSVVVENEAAHHPLDWRTILLTPSWLAQGESTIAYRPLTTWTFALDYAVHGDRPLGYHLVNVLAHATVAALVVWLAAAVDLPASAAGLAGALFAVHPIHTEAVANVVGRAEILAAGLVLLALLAQRRVSLRARPWLVAAAYGLALLAKEHAIALLVLLPFADFLFDDGCSPTRFVHRLAGRRALSYAALVAVTAGYFMLRTAALGQLVGDVHRVTFWMNPAYSVPAGERLLTALKVQALAVWLLLVPIQLSADYSYRQIPVVSSAAEPGAIAGMLVAAALVLLEIALWRRRVAFFWLALALVTYGVVSNLLFPIGTIFGERLLYLPSVGFCALVAMVLARPGWSRAVAVVLLFVWSVRTALRTPVWHDDLHLGEATVGAAPDSGHAHHALGTTYSGLGRDQEALAEFARALAIDPTDTGSIYNTGVILQQRNQLPEALAAFERVTRLDPNHFPAWINQASIDNQQQRFGPALDAADHAVALASAVPNAHVVRGFALRGLGRLAEARAAFEEALHFEPARPERALRARCDRRRPGRFRARSERLRASGRRVARG